MKMVFTNASVIPCDMIVSMLDAAGIQAIIRNEQGSAASGYSIPMFGGPSLPWAWPEVWVGDEDYERALELIDGVETDAESEATE